MSTFVVVIGIHLPGVAVAVAVASVLHALDDGERGWRDECMGML